MISGVIPSILIVVTAAAPLVKPASYSDNHSKYRLDGKSVSIEKVSDQQGINNILINNATIRNLNKIDEIKMLNDGWDGKNAAAFDNTLLDKIRSLVLSLDAQPEIFPLADGRIQLEYELEDGSYLEFHIDLTEESKVFMLDAQGKPSQATIKSCTESINQLVKKFYGREF